MSLATMDFLGAVLVVVGFAYLIYVFGLVRATKLVLSISRDAAQVIRSNDYNDEEKEQLLQSGSIRLFRLLAFLIIGTLGALLFPFGLVWVGQILGIMTYDGVMKILLRWDFIVGASLLGIGTYFCLTKWSQRNS